MLRFALLIGLLGAASAANPQAKLQRDIISTATNKLLRGQVSAEAAARIENVLNALGNANLTEPTQQYNPNLPDQGPPVQVSATQPAPWHAIARPDNAICAVSPYYREQQQFVAGARMRSAQHIVFDAVTSCILETGQLLPEFFMRHEMYMSLTHRQQLPVHAGASLIVTRTYG